MAGLISSSEWGAALWPGVNAWFGQAYDEHGLEWPDLFDKFSDSRYMVEDIGTVGLGLPKVKDENAPFEYEGTEQGFKNTYRHIVYGLGMVITAEVIDDDQYGVVGESKAKALGFSMRQGKEVVGANVYNNAFNSSFTGGDGVEMISASHLNKSGGTFSNLASTDLSEAALEQACIDIMKIKNDKSLNIAVLPQTLILPPDLIFEAERILKSELRVGVANNDLNALKSTGKFPGGVKVNHYLTDADAWFIRNNVPNGLKLFERWPLRFDQDNSFDNNAVKFVAFERYSVGWTDPRAVYGSAGV